MIVESVRKDYGKYDVGASSWIRIELSLAHKKLNPLLRRRIKKLGIDVRNCPD